MFSGGGSHPNWLAHRHENVILPPPSELFSSFPMPSSQQPYSGQTPQSLFPIKEPMTSAYGGLFPPQLPTQGTPTAPGRPQEFPPAASAAELQWTPWPGHPIVGKNPPFPAAATNGLPPFTNTSVSHAYPAGMNVSNGYAGYQQARNTHSPYPARNTHSPYSARNAHSPFSQSSHSPYPSRNAQSPYSRNAHSPYGSRNAQSPYSMNAHSPYSSHNSPSPYSGQSGHSPGYSKQNISDNDFQLMLGGAFLGTRLSSDITDANSAPSGGQGPPGGVVGQDGVLKDSATKRLTHLPHPTVRPAGGSVVGSPQAKVLDDQGRLSHPNMTFDIRTSQQTPTVATSVGSISSTNSTPTSVEAPQLNANNITPKNNTFVPNSPQKLSHPPVPAQPPVSTPQTFSPPKNVPTMTPFSANATNPACSSASPIPQQIPAPACSVASQDSGFSGNLSNDRGTPLSTTSTYDEKATTPEAKESVPVSQSFGETTPLTHEYKKTDTGVAQEFKPEFKQEFSQEFKQEYKQDFKPEFKQEFNQEFKPEFKPEFKQEFKNEFEPQFKTDIKQEFKDNQQQPMSHDYNNEGRPLSQPISQPISQPMSQPVSRPMSQPMSQSGQLMSQSGQPMSQPPPMSQSGQPMSQTGQPMSQPGRPMSQPGRPMSQPGQPLSQPPPMSQQQSQPMSHANQPMSQAMSQGFSENQNPVSHEFNNDNNRHDGRPLSQMSQGYATENQQQQQQPPQTQPQQHAPAPQQHAQQHAPQHAPQQPPHAQNYHGQPQPHQVSQSFQEDHNNLNNMNHAFDNNQAMSQSDDALSFSDASSLSQSFNGAPQGFPGHVENGSMPQNGPHLGPAGPMAHAVSMSQGFPENNSIPQSYDLGRQTSPNLALMSNYADNPPFTDNPGFMTPTYAGSESHDSFPEEPEPHYPEPQFTPKKMPETPPTVKGRKKKLPRKDDALIEITGVVEDSRRARGAKGTLTAEEVFEYLGQKSSVCSFQCHYESCKERFMDVAIYIQHCLQQHQAYICHECGKDFTTKSSLLRHRHIHTGLHRFACSICKKTFYRKDKCRAHIKRHLMEGNAKGAIEDVCVPAPRK